MLTQNEFQLDAPEVEPPPAPTTWLGRITAAPRWMVISGALAAIAIGVGLILMSVWPTRSVTDRTLYAYYTTDDGTTLVVDDIHAITPFDHNGQPAVRARVFSFDGGKTQRVAFLQRYTEKGRERFSALAADQRPNSNTVVFGTERDLVEVKLPGTSEWIKVSDPRAGNILRPRPEGNSRALPREIVPHSKDASPPHP